jgi:2',3'-cyclic-nucleotide 2'-phosphodiesterase (5'-nucleotidase family)
VKRLSRIGATAIALTIFAGVLAAAPSADRGDDNDQSFVTSSKAILFASDGMRPDLAERYASMGLMPTFKDLIENGVSGKNGLLQGFPPNTGVGWHTLATGTWPGEHGSTNNTFHRTGDAFNNTSSFATTGILQADTLLQSAERAGKTVVAVEWVAARGLVPALQGPVIDFRTFIGGRGIVLNFDLPGQPALAQSFGVQYQRRDLANATGWTNVPASAPGSPAKETFFRHGDSRVPGDGPDPTATSDDGNWDVYIYDSTNDGTVNYDRIVVVNRSAAKNGSGILPLSVGQWEDRKLTLTSAAGALAGRTAGVYMKLIDLNADASQFRLYFTSVQRVNATYNALGQTGSDDFAETLARDFPTSTAADFAPLEALIVDEDTYVEQGLKWADAHFAYLRHILGDGPGQLNVDADMLFLGNPVTDEFSHQFLGLLTETDIDGRRNPYFDNVDGMGATDGRLDEREGYIRAAYHEADATLALGRELMGKSDATVMASSDHGFAPQWLAINARKILFDKKITPSPTTGNPNPTPISLHPSGDPALAGSLSNCRAGSELDLAKACWAGGTVQIYVNPALPPGVTYEQVRTAVREAFASLIDPGVVGQRPSSTNAQVILKIMNKEELRNVDGTDSLHPTRSGDVVAVSRPPYQFDAATAGQNIAFSQFFGQHGYTPDLVNLKRNVNMHGSFFAAGPGIRGGGGDDGGDDDEGDRRVSGMRAIDVAPTMAFVLGIPGPQNARGKIRYDIVENTGDTRELTILNISDYHGQLVPLSENADFVIRTTPPFNTTAIGPLFGIGGSAFLKPWFDIYRREAKDGSITIAGGDSVGATPPISNHFGDTTTIEFMNRMGFDADGLGNHNFDRGQAYLRETLIPLAKFDFVSANVVDSAGKTPREWSPSETFNFNGAKLGLIGFSNTDIPQLTFPGALGPFHVEDPLAAVNAEAARLTNRTDALVAVGHFGVDGGAGNPLGLTTSPFGPLIDLADNADVDAVVGDHTNFQVLEVRSNGVLVTENLSKSARFTRLRLVVDKSSNEVIYKTADFHKPWNIGVTPDRGIQARIDELNAILAPILGVQVGKSTVQIPRSDVCNRVDGRLCESLIGDVVTDSMRTAFAAVDFAITNSGGVRDRLTCPTTDNPTDFCLADLYPFPAGQFPITLGQVVAVLPFGNIVATAEISGTQLKTMLENGVSRSVDATTLANSAQGRFPQVSGLCFTYDIAAPAGSRVTQVLQADATGACPAASPAVGLGAGDMYTVAINDFMAFGGDGYPNLVSQLTTPSVKTMDARLADYIGEQTDDTISPSIQGRIRCIDGNGAALPNCPAGSP